MRTPELETLKKHFNELLDILAEERNALTAHDGEALDGCVERKAEVCQAISQTLNGAPALAAELQRASVPAADPHQHDDIDADHKSLLDLARAARDSNLVNGKILHRSQQSIREILGILSGKSLDGLYGQSGQHTAGPGTGSNAIARA